MAFVEKGLRLVIKCVAVFFEMHEMCGASFHSVYGRRFQRVEEPMSINVGSEAVPFASDDRDRRADPFAGRRADRPPYKDIIPWGPSR